MNPIERTFKKQRNIGVGEPLKCLASDPRARVSWRLSLEKIVLRKGWKLGDSATDNGQNVVNGE